jgi:hypothetical protein
MSDCWLGSAISIDVTRDIVHMGRTRAHSMGVDRCVLPDVLLGNRLRGSDITIQAPLAGSSNDCAEKALFRQDAVSPIGIRRMPLTANVPMTRQGHWFVPFSFMASPSASSMGHV